MIQAKLNTTNSGQWAGVGYIRDPNTLMHTSLEIVVEVDFVDSPKSDSESGSKAAY